MRAFSRSGGPTIKTFFEILAAWWSDDATEAGLPATPNGEVPTLQSDFTVQWSRSSIAASVIEDGEFVYEDGSPVNE